MGTVGSEKVEQRPCKDCGEKVAFRIIQDVHDRIIEINLGRAHRAPCGRWCIASTQVSMRQVIEGEAHHPKRCECRNVGRGFETPGKEEPGSVTRSEYVGSGETPAKAGGPVTRSEYVK